MAGVAVIDLACSARPASVNHADAMRGGLHVLHFPREDRQPAPEARVGQLEQPGPR